MLLLQHSQGIYSGYHHATLTTKNLFLFLLELLSLWEEGIILLRRISQAISGCTMPPLHPKFFLFLLELSLLLE